MNILKHLEVLLDSSYRERYLKLPNDWKMDCETIPYEYVDLNRYRLMVRFTTEFSADILRRDKFINHLSRRLGNYLYGDLVDSLVSIKHNISNKNWTEAIDQIDNLIDEYENIPKNVDIRNV